MLKGYKAIFQELCGTALNYYPAGELQKLISKSEEELSEDESSVILEAVKSHYRNIITQINTTNNKALDEKFKAGQRKAAQDFEKNLKETFSVESDKQGADLIDEISEQLSKKSKGKSTDLSDDDIKKHATFLKMEKEYKKQLEDTRREHEEKISGIQAEASRKDRFAKVSTLALEKFESMNPVLSDDPKKAAKQRELVLRELQAYDYEEVDGKFIPMKEGKRVEDEFGHALELDKLVEGVTSPYFDFKVAQERKAPNGQDAGKDKTDPGKQHSYSGKLPKTEAEYLAIQNDNNLPLKDRIFVNDWWEKNQPQ
jgi:hypothetical protein